jgi:ribosomal protein L20A (L18A)
MKIRPVGAEMFHADGQSDMRLIVAFRNSANAPKKLYRFFGGKTSRKDNHVAIQQVEYNNSEEQSFQVAF